MYVLAAFSRVAHEVFEVHGEPTVDVATAGTEQAVTKDCNGVIAIGGGSVLDVGKVIAALITNGGEPLDYMEVVGKGQKITKPSAPFVAVPTTAGKWVHMSISTINFIMLEIGKNV